MKRILAISCLTLVVVAGAAHATTPGVNLSWANCVATTTASGDKAYACDGAFGSPFGVQGTFRIGVAIPDFAGVASVLDVGFNAPVPDYWKTASGECNAGALSAVNPSATSPCNTTNIFDPAYSGGGYALEYNPSGDRFRLRIDWATGAPVPPSIVAGDLYPAFKIQFDPDQGVNNGCAGCTTPGCMVFNSAEVFGFVLSEDYLFETTDVRDYVTWQGGAIGGAGCPAVVPTRNVTWGSIKSLYR